MEPSHLRKIGAGGFGTGQGHRPLEEEWAGTAAPGRGCALERPRVRAKAGTRDMSSESFLGSKGEHPTTASRLRLWVGGCGRGFLCPPGNEEAGLAFNLVVGTIHMTMRGPVPAGPIPPDYI